MSNSTILSDPPSRRRNENPLQRPQPALLSYISDQCIKSRQSTLKRSLKPQPSLVEGKMQHHAVKHKERRFNSARAIINIEDLKKQKSLHDLDGCATTAATSSVSKPPSKQKRTESLTSTDHAECLRWSMRSLSSTNTLQTLATTAGSSPTFSMATSPSSSALIHRKAKAPCKNSSRKCEQSGWLANWTSFQTCMNLSQESGSQKCGYTCPMATAIPEDAPAQIGQPYKETPCMATLSWLASFLAKYKRPTAFEYNDSFEQKEISASLSCVDDASCPSGSHSSCISSSICSACDDSVALVHAPNGSIVDKTPDQVKDERKSLSTDPSQTTQLEDSLTPHVVSYTESGSPVGLSFVSFSKDAPEKEDETVSLPSDELCPEGVLAETHFSQGLQHERRNHLDHAMASFQEAMRCTLKVLEITVPVKLLQCRVKHAISVLQWKDGQYSHAVQTLNSCISTLAILECKHVYQIELALRLAESHRQLGVVYTSLGSSNDFDLARKHLQESLRLCRSEMCLTPKKTAARYELIHSIAHSLIVLGNLNKEKGNYSKAVTLYQRGLDMLVKEEDASRLSQNKSETSFSDHNSNSALIAHTFNQIGEVCQNQLRDTQKAMDMYSEALWLYRVCFGHEHVDVAMTMLHIGQVHMEWHEFVEAREAFNEALKVFESVLGTQHRNVATTLFYLAQLQVREGRLGEALALYEEAVEIQRECLGDFHSDVAATFHAMASIYEQSAQYTNALRLYKWTLHIYKINYGAAHSFTSSVSKDVARLFQIHH